MAEIKIEKKKAVWPWVIGIIILALLIYFLAFNRNNKDTTPEKSTTDEMTELNVGHHDEVLWIVEV